jgi:hypothetical protein
MAAGEIVNCDFDHGWCGWNNNDHNCFNWTIDRGETTDKTSGPISDHTTDSECVSNVCKLRSPG